MLPWHLEELPRKGQRYVVNFASVGGRCSSCKNPVDQEVEIEFEHKAYQIREEKYYFIWKISEPARCENCGAFITAFLSEVMDDVPLDTEYPDWMQWDKIISEDPP